MTTLTREQILAADDMELSDPIDVPEWGGTIRCRTMMGADRDAMELRQVDHRQSLIDSGEYESVEDIPTSVMVLNLRAETVAACACDDDGNLLFTVDDVEALGQKSGKALDRVFSVAKDLNALSDQDVQELAGES